MIPGEFFLAQNPIAGNLNKTTVQITVVNTGDRPVQVGSHFHFFETNKKLQFERASTIGMRLNIPSGTAVRFEPGEQKQIELVSFSGNKKIIGFSGLVNGLDLEQDKKILLERIQAFINLL